MSHSESSFIETDLQKVNSTFSDFTNFLRDFAIILIIVFFIRSFVVTPFQINGQSMEASYHDKEFILVDKFSYLNFSQDMGDPADGPGWTFLTNLWQQIPIHI